MKLHENKDVFVELIQATAQKYSIPELYVEKDYWVTRSLKFLSESDLSTRIVFKGGTSLSKAHKIINRFSEDIDLAAICEDLSKSQTKALVKKAQNILSAGLAQVDDENKSSNSLFRKANYQYPRVITGG